MSADSSKASVWQLVALGIGSMVGAGIFALLGEAATLAGSAVWLSFLAAGIIALLTGHSFVQLGVRYPSRGGVVEYLVQAYGPGIFSGACSILFYIAQLVGAAMISLTFGKFAVKLAGIEADLQLWERVLASGLILTLSALQLVGSKLVSRAQQIMVLLNLAILSAFAIGLSGQAQDGRLAAETWPAATSILGSLALTFFAFTGFAVISNAADRMAEPKRDLPRAMYLAISLVIALYVGLSLALVASVDAAMLEKGGAALIAEAARTHFGDVGYIVLLVCAVAATVTCLNGGLFGIAGITFALAENGQLPNRFGKELRASTRGLTISAGIVLLMVNFFSLTSVASLGSATSLLVYMLVNIGALRLVQGAPLRRALIWMSVAACAIAIMVWAVHALQTRPSSLLVFLTFLALSAGAEVLLQRRTGRRILPECR